MKNTPAIHSLNDDSQLDIFAHSHGQAVKVKVSQSIDLHSRAVIASTVLAASVARTPRAIVFERGTAAVA